MLLVKPIVLIFTIASITLLTQFSSFLSYSILMNSFDANRIYTINLIHPPVDLNIDRLNLFSEYLSVRSSRKKLPINRVKKQMKIKFRQAGGYAGLRLGCDLDTNLLSAPESIQLESLVKTRPDTPPALPAVRSRTAQETGTGVHLAPGRDGDAVARCGSGNSECAERWATLSTR